MKTMTELPRTKLVCTIGPASDSAEMISAFINAGMCVARLNFSHGSHEDHARRLRIIRETAKSQDMPVAILQDLQGPKIRTGQLKGGFIDLVKGQKRILRYSDKQMEDEIPIDYAHLAQDVAVGARILLDDGLMAMKVVEINGADVVCEVVYGGRLKPRKGVNFPDSHLSIPATTEKDIRDLFFGVSQGVDYIALSFVQAPEDIVKLKTMIKSFGAETPVVAKIEMKRAVENLEAICRVADALMVARGDLGVECGFANVASLQKRIIAAAHEAGIPVIVATQMLDSMQEHKVPTKAEVMDVANAVYDLADATMLSGESASGQHPLLSVQTMRDITRRADESLHNSQIQELRQRSESTSDILAHSVAELARQVEAKAIVCLSMTGNTARAIASYHPAMPIFALSPRPDIVQRLALVRGVHPILNSHFFDTDKAILNVSKILAQRGFTREGDKLVITAGIPLGDMRPTNMAKLHHVTNADFEH
jgi:pyruvate kinase